MISCIAIDDEPKALTIIESHVNRVDFLELKSTFVEPFRAISYLTEHSIDLIFLDIDMPDISGFEFLKHLPNKPKIVFTTAHSEYAIQSYEVEATDYLLKPFDFSRFLLAVTKVKDKISEVNTSTNQEFLFLNTGPSKRKILIDDIIYIESDGNYMTYITSTEKLLVRASIKDVLKVLPPQLFVQVQRSFIVAIRWIDKIENNHIHLPHKTIPIGNTFKDDFFAMLKKYGG